ncbi:MAG: hypothetical protein AAB150_11640 [Pseudomonadota bacterium]
MKSLQPSKSVLRALPAGIGRVERFVTIYTRAAQAPELSFNALVTP